MDGKYLADKSNSLQQSLYKFLISFDVLPSILIKHSVTNNAFFGSSLLITLFLKIAQNSLYSVFCPFSSIISVIPSLP